MTQEAVNVLGQLKKMYKRGEIEIVSQGGRSYLVTHEGDHYAKRVSEMMTQLYILTMVADPSEILAMIVAPAVPQA